MAQQTVVTFVDDLDGSTDDVDTVTFHDADGRPLQIDLSKENRETLTELQGEFSQSIAGFVESARPAAGEPVRRRRQVAAVKPRTGREETAAIRAWARDNGHEISGRGRIPKTVVDAYQAAH